MPIQYHSCFVLFLDFYIFISPARTSIKNAAMHSGNGIDLSDLSSKNSLLFFLCDTKWNKEIIPLISIDILIQTLEIN